MSFSTSGCDPAANPSNERPSDDRAPRAVFIALYPRSFSKSDARNSITVSIDVENGSHGL